VSSAMFDLMAVASAVLKLSNDCGQRQPYQISLRVLPMETVSNSGKSIFVL
jgi:hypothetical protein